MAAPARAPMSAPCPKLVFSLQTQKCSAASARTKLAPRSFGQTKSLVSREDAEKASGLKIEGWMEP